MRTILCSKCGGINLREGQRYCLACHRAYNRQWRTDHSLTGEARKKDIARSYAQEYEKRGHIIRQPCAECGAEKAQKHHPDYSRPTFVVWLCQPCHMRIHKEEYRKNVQLMLERIRKTVMGG